VYKCPKPWKFNLHGIYSYVNGFALFQVASFDVKTVMYEWTNHKGYPLIQIKFLRNSSLGKVYEASQMRFISDMDTADPNYQNETRG